MSSENMNEDTGVEETTQTPETQAKPVSTFRLVATLAVAGTLAGLLIVMVNQHTKPIVIISQSQESTTILNDGRCSFLLLNRI